MLIGSSSTAVVPATWNQKLQYYFSLNQGGRSQAEYIWIGGSGQDLRCKTRSLDKLPTKIEDFPHWNYDGSSTGQASGEKSEVVVVPRAFYPDPFRPGPNFLVLCDTYTPELEPIPSNTRHKAAEIFEKAKEFKPWFGIEQEYTLLSLNMRPLGWPDGGFPSPQGPYYCSVGADRAFGREIVEAHYRACLYAGVTISGINAEVLCGQWEYQVGPVEGIAAADQHWISRYLLHRVAESFSALVSFDPKPIGGDWNGSGCHTNFSTKAMRERGGIDVIHEAVEKLGKKHAEHIRVYGEGNERRLTGKHETASMHTFSAGVGNRGCSIRIPNMAVKEGFGYFEDRRPASNMDPYVVTSKLVETTCLDESVLEDGEPSH